MQGFQKHVKDEHNQWAYLFFFIHLDETRPNDYSALELYVYKLVSSINKNKQKRKQQAQYAHVSILNVQQIHLMLNWANSALFICVKL